MFTEFIHEIGYWGDKILASVSFPFCFCCFNSSFFAFNAAISFDWFCWLIFYASLVCNLNLFLECCEAKDWSFCCTVLLSPVRFLFWLMLLDVIFVSFTMFVYVGFKVYCFVLVCLFVYFSYYQVGALSN